MRKLSNWDEPGKRRKKPSWKHINLSADPIIKWSRILNANKTLGDMLILIIFTYSFNWQYWNTIQRVPRAVFYVNKLNCLPPPSWRLVEITTQYTKITPVPQQTLKGHSYCEQNRGYSLGLRVCGDKYQPEKNESPNVDWQGWEAEGWILEWNIMCWNQNNYHLPWYRFQLLPVLKVAFENGKQTVMITDQLREPVNKRLEGIRWISQMQFYKNKPWQQS